MLPRVRKAALSSGYGDCVAVIYAGYAGILYVGDVLLSLGAFCFLGCCVWSDFGSVGFASSSGCGGLVMVLTDGTVSKRDRASARLRLTDFHIMSYG